MKIEDQSRSLFGISLSDKPRWQQFLICSSGFFFGYLVNGICEEYVYNRLQFSYGWYFTFVQGFVYIFLIYLQGFSTKQMVNPWKTYVNLSAVLMASHGLTKGSLAFLNYPAQIMFKSTKVLPVMIMGAFIPGLRRKYPAHEYISALLLVVGLILFTLADAQTSPNFSIIGVLMISGALIMDSFLGNLQEAIFAMNPETTQTEMLFCSTVVGLPFLIPPMLLTGELFRAWKSCAQHPYVYGVLVFEAMCTFIGQVSVLSLIVLFGAATTAMSEIRGWPCKMAEEEYELPEGTVQNILDQKTLKWVFVGGKGGVGKTTCSSIISILLARVRSSVLIISTDPAHNLSDAFQQRFTKAPTKVNGFTNLYAMEVDPNVENEEVTGSDGMDSLFSDLANAIPGIDEAMSFAEMLKLVQTMDYSVIVFDTAPTGHTLRLLQFPSTLERGLVKMMSLKSKFGGVINQMTRLFGIEDEFGEDALLGRLEGMKEVIEQVNKQFKNPDMTTFVCVCIPEFLSLYETERLVQELAKFEIDTHNIIINQVLFEEEGVESKLLKARMRMQQKYLDQFYMLYDDFNITKLPLLPEEVTGPEALNMFCRHFLTPYNPSTYKGTVEELEQRVSLLSLQLKDTEGELERVKKGK